jgi:prevent-host-death family protein
MQKTVSVMKARQNLGQIMNEVSLRGDDVIIERAGKPVAVLISIEKYQIMEKSRQKFWEAVNQIRENMRGEDPEEIERLIEEAVLASRKK